MTGSDDKPLAAALKALNKSNRMAQSDVSEAGDVEKTETRDRPGADTTQHLKKFTGITVLPGVHKVLGVADLIWNQWARPVTRFLTPVTRRIWGFYRWSYARFAHVNEEGVKGQDSERAFSSNRAAIVTIFLIAITFATPFLLVRHIIPTASRTIYDAGMLATMKEDTLFLGRAELIDPDRNLFQVTGCRDITGCEGGDNTTYYRLRDNVILDIKYWTTRFEPYDPAEIAGAMVSELNDCTITYYGRRSKALGWYPYIVSASCKPV